MKYFFSLLSIVTLFLLQGGNVLFAQSETHTVRVFGAEDVVSPTTPTLLSASPIATTQINIAWTAATDNQMVAGYVLLRDGAPVATTTLLSYSDAGLTASTTYMYAVRAFDTVFNYSSTSNTIATTTLAVPVVPPPATTTDEGGGGTTGTAARVVAKTFLIDTGVSTTSFLITTAHQARLEIRWGRTSSYELGYVVKNTFSKEHTIMLTDLEAGTEYEYEVVGYTPYGAGTVVKRGSFVTKTGDAMSEVSNVQLFTATEIGADVSLQWQLPDASITQVRVVRNHYGFPEHPQDGAVVYQGSKEQAIDVGVLAEYSPVYYTAFAYDAYGNVSSGAVAIVYATRLSGSDKSGSEQSTAAPIVQLIEETTVATSTVTADRLTVDMKMPQLSDVVIAQNGTTFSFAHAPFMLDATQDFIVSLPRYAVAGNLKSIIVTIIDPSDVTKNYSFLLRLNRDRSAYEARIAPVTSLGHSLVTLEVYDYEAFVVGTYRAPVTFIAPVQPAVVAPVLFPDIFFQKWPQTLLGIITLLAVVLFFFLRRKKGEDNA